MELSKCDPATIKAFEEFVRIVQHNACLEGDEAFELLKNSLEQWPHLIAACNSYGKTLLMIAASLGRTNIAFLLLRLGSFIDAQDSEGNTALMLAIASYRYEVVALLIFFGANPHIRNRDQFDAFTLACTLENTSMLAFLTRMQDGEYACFFDKNAKNVTGNTNFSLDK
jgi:ankyrin repeat protein